jgi:hypothetical protein
MNGNTRGIIMKFRNIFGLSGSSVIAFAALLGLPSADAANGIQFDEMNFAGSAYVDCLGEFVDFEEHVDIAYHEFVTPSGNYHLVDTWKFTIMATGQATGRTWAGVLSSPGEVNAGPGEVAQFSIQGVLRSITKHAPSFFWGLTFKTTVNANGELVVERGSFDTFVRCNGKN